MSQSQPSLSIHFLICTKKINIVGVKHKSNTIQRKEIIHTLRKNKKVQRRKSCRDDSHTYVFARASTLYSRLIRVAVSKPPALLRI